MGCRSLRDRLDQRRKVGPLAISVGISDLSASALSSGGLGRLEADGRWKEAARCANYFRERAFSCRGRSGTRQVRGSGRPGPLLIDLPVDLQKEVIEFDPDSNFQLEVFKPRANPKTD